MDSGYSGEFLGMTHLLISHELSGLQYGATVPWVGVYVSIDQAILVLQERSVMMPEEIIGK